ncbi:MAG: DnaB-like helicase C-terminal domain-containing protein [Crocinitomicaceae bacterium]|nr:DnaB-like helicase C-terminal domain-containing protein [Crocinitomicaceae bacterium]
MTNPLHDELKKLVELQGISEHELLHELRFLLEQRNFKQELGKEPKDFTELVKDKMDLLLNTNLEEGFLKTGFAQLDELTGGLHGGEMVVFGGRPGMGKTSVLVNLSLNLARQVPVLYFSFDLGADALMNRFISGLSEVPVQKIERIALDDAEKVELIKVMDEWKKLPLYIHDTGNHSLSLIRLMCEKAVKEKGVRVIVMDYLQLMKTHRFKNNRDLEISMITREIKNMARELGLCFLVSSQLSRSAETRGGDKRPYLSDLRESGAIEQEADKVFFVYRPEYYGLFEDETGMPTDGILELILAKNRTGPLNTIKLGFEKETGRLRNGVDQTWPAFKFNSGRLDELKDGAPF